MDCLRCDRPQRFVDPSPRRAVTELSCFVKLPHMKACLFDIDGTLVLTGGAGQVAFAQVFEEEFGIAEITSDISFAGRSDRAIASDLMRYHGIEPDQPTWERFIRNYLQRLPVALRECQGEVLPGVVELIQQLQQRGDVLIGLLTGNIERAAEHKLSYYDLWSHFDFGGFGDHHPNRDDIARTAATEARKRHNSDSNAEEVIVVIGDTPNDITCARAIGAKAVAVPTGHTPASELEPHQPDLLIETLEDGNQILEWFDA